MGFNGKIKELEYEDLKNQFVENVKDIESSLNKIKSTMSAINGQNNVWRGKTALSFYNKYKEYENNFGDIASKLDSFNSYLNITLENYKRAIAESKKTVEETEENYNIN